MENITRFQSVKGSVFDADRTEGIAVFIPMGLAGIRCETLTDKSIRQECCRRWFMEECFEAHPGAWTFAGNFGK
jgi:hypothetical protein